MFAPLALVLIRVLGLIVFVPRNSCNPTLPFSALFYLSILCTQASPLYKEDAVYIALYVDDLFLVGRKLSNMEVVKRGLHEEFKMKDLGDAKFLLGIEIRRQKNGDVFLVQERYARDVIGRFNMEGCKPVSTPLDLGCHLDTA